MKKIVFVFLLAVLLSLVSCLNPPAGLAPGQTASETTAESVSDALGENDPNAPSLVDAELLKQVTKGMTYGDAMSTLGIGPGFCYSSQGTPITYYGTDGNVYRFALDLSKLTAESFPFGNNTTLTTTQLDLSNPYNYPYAWATITHVFVEPYEP